MRSVQFIFGLSWIQSKQSCEAEAEAEAEALGSRG